MSFDRIVGAVIKEAMEGDQFDNLPGKGKPIDLTEYFKTPEEVRFANSVLKTQEIEEQIQQKHVEFGLMMERQNVNGGKSKINGSRQRLSGDKKYIHP